MTIQEFKNQAQKELSNSPSPALDTQVLLEYITGFSKTQILLNRDSVLTEEQLNWLKEAVSKRQEGLPVAYITGHKEFYGYDFFVSPAVLIPKPDTEILVEKAIDSIIEKMENRNGKIGGEGAILSVCDMCTGSGCIAISVIKSLLENYNVPEDKLPKFTLVDISKDALEIAKINAERLLSEDKDFSISIIRSKLQFIQSNLFMNVPYKFDVILTNPPYIPHSMVDELLQDGRKEPRLALDGDVDIFSGDKSATHDGLSIIRELIPQAREHIAPFGTMIMETGEYNAEETEALTKEAGFSCELYSDLENQLRGVVSQLKK